MKAKELIEEKINEIVEEKRVFGFLYIKCYQIIKEEKHPYLKGFVKVQKYFLSKDGSRYVIIHDSSDNYHASFLMLNTNYQVLKIGNDIFISVMKERLHGVTLIKFRILQDY